MKYAIRRGVFETNSSSTHSVQFIEKGSEVEIEIHGKRAKAEVVKTPFYKNRV